MFSACCCADADGGDVADDLAMIRETPRKDMPGMPELPAVARECRLSKRGKESGSLSNATREGTNFTANITRNPDDAIGLDIDVIDEVSVVVCEVKEGAVRKWIERNGHLVLQAHDRIIEVNGLRMDTNAMVQTLKAETTWTLLIQRPVEFVVSISRADAPSLGMDLRYAPKGKTLMVTQIGDGPLQRWNQAHQAKAVCKHDRIVELNRVRGTPMELLRASQDAEVLNMTVLHYDSLESSFAPAL